MPLLPGYLPSRTSGSDALLTAALPGPAASAGPPLRASGCSGGIAVDDSVGGVRPYWRSIAAVLM